MAQLSSFSAWALRCFASLLVLVGTALSADTYKVLFTFGSSNGAYPYSNLVADGAGNLYGTTSQGGVYGYGVVFKLSPLGRGRWMEQVLHSFNGTDGRTPLAGVVLDAAGNLYGTTAYGGLTVCTYSNGCGVVFELSPGTGGNWSETTLYQFQGGQDAAVPISGVTLDAAGNLYGTAGGGTYGYGAVFQLTRNLLGVWTESVLYSFNYVDGTGSYGLVLDKAGNLYGVTDAGGDLDCNQQVGRISGCGVVFQLMKNSNGLWTENLLHVFGWTDGAFPSGSLVLDASGNIYGTTSYGPVSSACNYSGCGTVFRLANDGSWSLQTIYQFAGGKDGALPGGYLVFDNSGNLYGATLSGGASTLCYFGCGTVFELSPDSGGFWKETMLRRFGTGTSQPPLEGPAPGLVVDSANNVYGAAATTGSTGYGGVFELSPVKGPLH